MYMIFSQQDLILKTSSQLLVGKNYRIEDYEFPGYSYPIPQYSDGRIQLTIRVKQGRIIHLSKCFVRIRITGCSFNTGPVPTLELRPTILLRTRLWLPMLAPCSMMDSLIRTPGPMTAPSSMLTLGPTIAVGCTLAEL